GHRIDLIDLATGQVRAHLRRPSLGLADPTFADGGRALVGQGRAGNSVVEFALASGRARVVGREPEVVGVLAAPRGDAVFATTLKQTAIEWRPQHSALARSVRYTAPGTGSLWLVVGAGGIAATSVRPLTTVRLWNLHTMRQDGPPLRTSAGWAA